MWHILLVSECASARYGQRIVVAPANFESASCAFEPQIVVSGMEELADIESQTLQIVSGTDQLIDMETPCSSLVPAGAALSPPPTSHDAPATERPAGSSGTGCPAGTPHPPTLPAPPQKRHVPQPAAPPAPAISAKSWCCMFNLTLCSMRSGKTTAETRRRALCVFRTQHFMDAMHRAVLETLLPAVLHPCTCSLKKCCCA